LKHLVYVLGPTKIDIYLSEFLGREFALKEEQELKSLRFCLKKLVEYGMAHGIPVDRSEFRPNGLKSQNAWRQNVEQALFIILSLISDNLEERLELDWPTDLAFAGLVRRNQDARNGPGGSLFLKSLRWLSFDGQVVECVDLVSADLSHSSFRGASVALSQMWGAYLYNTDFSEAQLYRLCLDSAYAEDATFSDVKANAVLAGSASFINCSFCDADAAGSDFAGAVLLDCDFTSAKFLRSNFRHAEFDGCDMRRADLSECTFGRASLSNSRFGGTSFKGADVRLSQHNKRQDMPTDRTERLKRVQDRQLERVAYRRTLRRAK
jgi:uncharacterized protein YjbI with pentapeptide repeats